ncbi:hypothetical protein EI77_03541 [Prosthecobacter fusiformis]|uniref:SnoaL-like domain-containing protein n=1 Tax=Prosthecobacter fusiformis TaxID=48464 RepID=A0A4R7RQ97_9BACT|nr:nuclear transport factor 2 family protein [Prosthecobacter fusiformis]TDU66447.1 hypothetical protein EI77_03541 [Prosthecobacter fusiformis]
MNTEPTPVITRFIEAMNAQDGAAFVTLFTPAAIVHDEGHTHQGHPEIQAWIEKAWSSYSPKVELRDVLTAGPSTVFAGEVSGSFDGSPIVLKHHLTIADDLITELQIAP